MNSGLIYIFTGDGKGKTSAALGVATRSLLLDKKVSWVAFYKQETWGLAESKLVSKFPKLDMFFGGKGFRITRFDKKIMNAGKVLKLATVGKGAKVVDNASEEEHQTAASQCLVQGQKYLTEKPFLLVMDEVLNAVTEGLITVQEVMEVLENRGETHIVLTGRSGKPTKRLVEGADLVTECVKVKHPYDIGKLAIAGLDF